MVSLKIPVLFLIKGEYFDILNAFLCHYIRELYTFKMVRFWSTLYMYISMDIHIHGKPMLCYALRKLDVGLVRFIHLRVRVAP